jgi:hypothetical protein
MPDLIMELYVFTPFFTSYYPYGRQNGTQSSKSNGMNNKY